MRKLITPLAYAIMLFPMTAIAVGIEMFMRSVGILGEWKGYIDLPSFVMFLSVILVFGIPLFWLVNLLIRVIEKLDNPSVFDHFRQSLFFYLIGVSCFLIWVVEGFGNTEEDGYLLSWIGISAIGIVVNYKFLFSRSMKRLHE